MLSKSKQPLLCITLLFTGYQLAMENGISLQNQSKWLRSDIITGLKHVGIRSGASSPMSFSSDGKYLLTLGGDPLMMEWDLAKPGTGKHIRNIVSYSQSWHNGTYDSKNQLGGGSNGTPQYSPDGSYIVYANGSAIMIYNLITKKLGIFNDNTYQSHTRTVNSIQFNKQGNLLLTSSDDASIKIWDVQTGGCLKTISVDSNYFPISFASFSFDEKLIIAATQIGTDIVVKIFDVSNGNCLKTFRENDYHGSVVYSPKGNYIAFTQGKNIKIWDMQDHIRSIVDSEATTVSFFVASPDGKFLATCHHTMPTGHLTKLKIWDIKRGICIQTIEYKVGQPYIHPCSILSGACFSPDNRLLAITHHDGTIVMLENQAIVTSNETLPAQQISIGQQQQQAQQQLAKAEQAMRQLQATKRQVQQVMVNEAKEEDVSQQNRQQQATVKSNTEIQEPQQEMRKCLVCTNETPATDFYKLSCGHEFCINCLNTIVDKDANERLCPDQACKQPIKRLDVTKIGYIYLLGKTTKTLAKTTKVLDSMKS